MIAMYNSVRGTQMKMGQCWAEMGMIAHSTTDIDKGIARNNK